MPMSPNGFIEPDNEDRADFANDAVGAYVERTRPADPYPVELGTLDEDDREALASALGDLLCDLRHWADVTGIDFDTADENGRGHYEIELEEAAITAADGEKLLS